jgi:hypothetical protein
MRMGWLMTLVLVVAATMAPIAVGVVQGFQAQGEGTEVCQLPEGWDPAEDLPRILVEHRRWLEQVEKQGDENKWSKETVRNFPEGRANLCNANLTGVNLTNALLRHTNLAKSNLSGATLNSIDLSGTNLTEAKLQGTKLIGARLDGANLTKAMLRGAVLTRAVLWGANLTEAGLLEVNLTAAQLDGADLTGSTYAPASPPDAYVKDIKGLPTVVFPKEGETGLIQLRELFQKAGLRDLERQATYAIERNRTQNAISGEDSNLFGRLEGVFRFIFFEITTGYGLYPGQALLIIFIVWAVLIVVYIWPIQRRPRSPKPASDIYRIWPSDRIETSRNEVKLGTSAKVERLQGKNWWDSFGYAAYFSLLSAFHIGWRDLNVGTWISRMQPREYALRATGWVRFVSGLQSLLSVYLLAIWALTYFGRPFQ